MVEARKKLSLFIIICIIVMVVIGFVYYYQNRITKESVIPDFNENYDVFVRVQNYISQRDVGFFINKSNLNDTRSLLYEVPDVMQDIEFILDKLNYDYICKDEVSPALKGIIQFQRKSGQEEFGIVYLKDSALKSFGQNSEHIRDGWYYYFIGNV